MQQLMENCDETWTRMVQPALCVAGQVTVVGLNAETGEVPTERFVLAVFMNAWYEERLDAFCALALMTKPKAARMPAANKSAVLLPVIATPLGLKLEASLCPRRTRCCDADHLSR